MRQTAGLASGRGRVDASCRSCLASMRLGVSVAAVRFGWVFCQSSLPQDPSGLGGTELAQWAQSKIEVGGSLAIGPEGQLAQLADRVAIQATGAYIHICI